MNKDELKEFILSGLQDVVFIYNGAHAVINYYTTEKLEVGFRDIVKIYTNIDDLMTDRIWDGKSLEEICENLDIN